MKRAIIVFLLSLLFLIGCTDSPVSTETPKTNTCSLIRLPAKSGLSVENIFSITQLMDGEQSDIIKLNEFYFSIAGHIVKTDAKFEISQNTFTGSVNIEMTIDDEYAVTSFESLIIFNKRCPFYSINKQIFA